MISIYEGNNIYTLHLESGRSLELDEREIFEIKNFTPDLNKIENKLKEAEDLIDELLEDIEYHGEYIRESENLVSEMENVVLSLKNKKAQEALMQLLKEMKSNNDALDGILSHI